MFARNDLKLLGSERWLNQGWWRWCRWILLWNCTRTWCQKLGENPLKQLRWSCSFSTTCFNLLSLSGLLTSAACCPDMPIKHHLFLKYIPATAFATFFNLYWYLKFVWSRKADASSPEWCRVGSWQINTFCCSDLTPRGVQGPTGCVRQSITTTITITTHTQKQKMAWLEPERSHLWHQNKPSWVFFINFCIFEML